MRVGEDNRLVSCFSHENIDDGYALFNTIEDGPDERVTIENSVALRTRPATYQDAVVDSIADGNQFITGSAKREYIKLADRVAMTPVCLRAGGLRD